jgi:hypothetical protein
MRPSILVFSALAGLAGCDQSGLGFRPRVTDVAAIQDLGELPVVAAEDIPSDGIRAGDLDGQVVYGQLGVPEDPAVTGGATFTFTGTGGNVCVVLDPEAVYWTRALAVDENGESAGYIYDDNVLDDADVDLEGGLTAYYNGSPGVEIGDFDAVYTDPLGTDHELQFNECRQTGYQSTPNTHSGRGTTEWCTVNTDQRAGVSFTIVVKTFSVPLDDNIANFAVGVFDGSCTGSTGAISPSPSEVFFRDEYALGEPTEYFSDLEEAFASNIKKLNNYCADHLDDENPPCFEHD